MQSKEYINPLNIVCEYCLTSSSDIILHKNSCGCEQYIHEKCIILSSHKCQKQDIKSNDTNQQQNVNSDDPCVTCCLCSCLYYMVACLIIN